MVRSWFDDDELMPLAARVFGATGREGRDAALTEAILARHLRERGCRLRFEVPTPNGRSCDFEVTLGRLVFALHVKRLRGSDPARRLTLPRRLRGLESIARPFVVALRWQQDLGDEGMRRLVDEAGAFIQDAQLGDELVVRADGGGELGRCRILARSEGRRVSLVLGLPTGFGEEVPRVQKLLRKAYQQFMPRMINVILVGARADDEREIETALLGTPAERWDILPPRGETVAHGRADDGFWSGRQFDESRLAGWFTANSAARISRSRIWCRDLEARFGGTALEGPESKGTRMVDEESRRAIERLLRPE